MVVGLVAHPKPVAPSMNNLLEVPVKPEARKPGMDAVDGAILDTDIKEATALYL